MIIIAANSITVNTGLEIRQDRIYQNVPTLLEPSVFRIGLGTTTAAVGDTVIEIPIPIGNGTVVDGGDNNLTGSTGGDNSTDNTTTFKQGAGQNDVTSQNLIANNTDTEKIWTLNPLTSNFTATEPVGFWFFIKDQTAFDKFDSDDAVMLKIRTNGDAANLFYSLSRTKAELSIGWNWVTSGAVNVEDLSTGVGGASGTLDEFIIQVVTNNATDTFVAGDVLYDLMRQWATSDLIKSFESGSPVLDTSNFETLIRTKLGSTEANGFDISEQGVFNIDASPKMDSHSTLNGVSKSDQDEIIFIEKHILTQV